ncbi:hypothetical protein HJFPF1_11664 [Paramyrothecium foliicola]|nr:hypothetical protein HJFPF1_11664 [Paramyrothecium foliicola]
MLAMEKQAAEERQRQWQSVRDLPNAGGTSCGKAFFCPCGAYARASSRLRSALGGLDALGPPDTGVINPDCVQFLVCFPFYGCFLAKLQTTVRAFYGLDGSDVKDWLDGCCCPCLTLMRAEQEVVFREKQHERLKDLNAPISTSWDQYIPQLPMTYGKPVVPDKTSNRPKIGSAEMDKSALSTIPEAKRESISGPVTASPPPPTPSPEPAPKNEDKMPANAKHVPLLRYLGQHWYLVPVGKKAKAKGSGRSEEEQVVETSDSSLTALAKVDDLHKDATGLKLDENGPVVSSRSISRTSTLVAYGLDAEEKAHKDSTVHLHSLVDHEKIKLPARPTLHHLEDHPKITRVATISRHRLQDDRKTSRSTQDSHSRDGNQTPGTSTPSSRRGRHGLEDDQSLFSIPASQVHTLDEDDAAQAASRTVAHALEDHAARTIRGYISTPHRIDDDDFFPDDRGSSTAHQLEDHAPFRHRSSKADKPHRLDTDRTASFEKFVTTHVLGQEESSPLPSPPDEGQPASTKALPPKRAWKSRFGRPSKLPQGTQDKARRKPKDDSDKDTSGTPVEGDVAVQTDSDESQALPLEKAKTIATHTLHDHAPVPMKDEIPSRSQEETKQTVTHTLTDHDPIPMRDEPPKPSTPGKDQVVSHMLKDDDLVNMQDDPAENNSAPLAKQPETHLLKDDSLVTMIDEEPSKADSTTNKTPTHTIDEEVLPLTEANRDATTKL